MGNKMNAAASLAAGLALVGQVSAKDMNNESSKVDDARKKVELATQEVKSSTQGALARTALTYDMNYASNETDSKKIDYSKFNYKINAGDDKLGIESTDGLTGVEYSSEYGVIFNVGVQINPNKSQSFILQGSIGEKEKRILAGAGFKVGENGMLSFMGEHLQQNREHSGESFDVKQNKAGVNFRFKSFELGGSYSKSGNKKLQDTDLIVDTDTLWQKYRVTNEFVGQEAKSGYIANTFDITQNSDLRALIGVTDIDGKMYLDGGLGYNIYMGKNGKVSLDANRRGETNSYGVGYEGNIGEKGVTWTATAEHIDGPNGYDDNRAFVKLNVPFGGKSSKKDFKKHKRDSNVNVADSLKAYVSGEKSYQVLGEVKQTGKKLLLEVEKTGLSADAKVDTLTGDIIVNGLNAFTAFTSITKNGGANSGNAFSIQGANSLLINSIHLQEPAVGTTDTYVLTTNGTPANTITIVVAKGSIIIKSIKVGIEAPANTAPTAVGENASTAFNTPILVDVLSNDTDAETGVSLTGVITSPVGGTFIIEEGKIKFIPTDGFVGIASANYEISDGSLTSTATLTIEVAPAPAPANTAPTAVGESTTTSYNTSKLVDVLSNDTDAETGVSLTGSITSQVGGTFVVESGKIRFTPTNGFSGTASATYEISDGSLTSTAILKIEVAPAPTPLPAPETEPIMGNVPNTTIVNGGGTTLNISNYTTITDGDAISAYTITGVIPVGLTFDNATGTFSGTTTATGTYNLSVTATDNDGVSNSDAFTITVEAEPETAPIMGNVPNTTIVYGGGTTLNIGNYTTITDGDTISAYTLTGELPVGLTFDSNTGTFAGNTTAIGTYNLSVTATDNDGVSNSDAFSLEVLAPNITSVSFTGTTPDTKSTAYVGLVLQTNTSIQSIASLTSTNGGVISNVSISGNQVTFDWAGCNAADTFFQLQATSTNNTETTVSVRQILEDLPNTAPTLNLTVISPDGGLKGDVYSLGVDYTLNNPSTLRLDASSSSDPEGTVDNFRVVSNVRGEMYNNSTLSYDVAGGTEGVIETFTLTITDNLGLTKVQTVSVAWE